METVFIYFAILGAVSGLSEGAGLLPDGPLNASAGGTVTFRTNLNPTTIPFQLVTWTFSTENDIIVSFPTVNITDPEYEGRITLFLSTGSLELRNLKLGDSGDYRVHVIPAEDVEKSGITRLQIYEPVSNVKVTPGSADLVELHSSVRLSCSSSGSSLSFLWMNNSSEVSLSNRVQISDGGSTLTIVDVTRYDQGLYSCHVSNPVSNARSDPVTLFISYGPENIQLNVSPSKHHYEEGADIRLICSVESRPSAEYQWFLDGVVLPDGPEYIQLVVSPSKAQHEEGTNINLICSAESRPPAEFSWFLDGDMLPGSGPELRLMDIQMSQQGNYSCEASNRKTLKYQKSQPSPVSVIARISNVVVKVSSRDLVEFNSSVQLFCSASGFSPSFLWMNGSSELTNGDRVQITDGGSTLTVFNVTRYDQGLLTCHVYNYFSRDSSNPVYLSIYYGPDSISLTVSPYQEKYEEGSDINMFCSAESNPPANFLWFLNETQLFVLGPNLRLTDIQLNENGNYSCQALNTETLVHKISDPFVISVVKTEGLSGGAIFGIVIACLVVAAGAAGAVGGYFMCKRKKSVSAPPDAGKREENIYEEMPGIYNRTISMKKSVSQ
ncbi:carcinoembryonic antigen-related cell adhesion molecule 5-like [Poecilia latipinna]|uniref:carcinoembryonic antigen-related cell adhesion molecule 5-like n=1 Tax=Poecilia latipinna TaxID=48699 RepID=UPI00072E6402|nr:PREDICTED: carcinoembryonic antigen-related cell adhesion molecule 5-like [Poecilia latipinna]